MSLKKHYHYKQHGFSVLLVIVVVSIIGLLWVSTQHQSIISMFKTKQIESDEYELNQVKNRLLEFAVLHSELYMKAKDETLADGSLVDGVLEDELFKDSSDIPSPGYLPCPDFDGDGVSDTPCGNPYDSGNPQTTGFVPAPDDSYSGSAICDGDSVTPCVGYVPSRIENRKFYFARKKKFYYFFDERYSFNNTDYYNYAVPPGYRDRFAPLSPETLDPEKVEYQGLVLNDNPRYIAIIIDGGTDGLNQENSNGDNIFESNINTIYNQDTADKVVGITYDEWIWYVGQKICTDSAGLQEVDENRPHWFNLHMSSNTLGSDWRDWGKSCR